VKEKFRERNNAYHPNFILEALTDIAGREGYGLEVKAAGKHDWISMHCDLETKDFTSRFDIQQMPGCCAVLTISYVYPKPYTKENFDRTLEIVEEAAKDAGFGSIIQTQVVPAFSRMLWKGEPWLKCLDRGWIASEAFMNAKSGNLCTYITKDLKQDFHKRHPQGSL
jgi:hypothetical protein